MLCDCGHLSDIHESEYAPGYVRERDTDKTLCYACAGTLTRESLERGENTLMYLYHTPISFEVYKRQLESCKHYDSAAYVYRRTPPGEWAIGVSMRVSDWAGAYSLTCSATYIYKRRQHVSTRIRFRTENGREYWGLIRGDTQAFIARETAESKRCNTHKGGN